MAATKIKVYNTQRISDEESLQNFIARKKEFRVLVNTIKNTHPNRPPQHQLIIGQRGMGKTTLLKRLEVELRQGPLNKRFIPLLFPEEQYNLDNLSTFWLNCLDALADILDIQGEEEEVKGLDQEIYRLVSLADIDQRAEKAYRFFCHMTFNLGRIPVLLIDNIDFVFRRLNKDELHVLRAFLTESGAPVVIGASSSTVIEAEDYDSPFYDAFQIHYLKKLSTQELLEIMRALAKNDDPALREEINQHKARLKAINQLTGGNPRTAVILYNQIQKGFSDTIVEDLDLILDELTPIYKARYEELSEKQQIIVNAIAMSWDPLSLDKIRAITGLEAGQLSPQLKRLAEMGWIEKPLNERYKGGAYELCERMFNIWYLMRRSSRRQKKGVFCLSKYLEAFYENEEELSAWINKLMASPLTTHYHAITALALAKLSTDKEERWRLHAKSRAYIKTNPTFIEQIDASDLYDSMEETIEAFKEAINQPDPQQILISTESLLAVPDKRLLEVIVKNRAIALVELARYEEGVSLLEKYSTLQGLAPFWVNLAAGIHNQKGSTEIVERCLLHAISSDKKYVEAFMYLGKLYTELGRWDEAEKSLKKASSLSKNDSKELVLAKGVLFSQYKQEEEGEALLRSVLAMDNQDPEALFYLGRYTFRKKKNDLGLSLFTQLQDLDKDNMLVRAWVHVANEQLQRKDLSSLQVIDNQSSKTDLAQFYRRIASVYHSEGMDDWAYQYWAMAVSVDAKDTESLILMTEYCINERLLDDAIVHVDKLLNIDPNNSDGLFLGGAAYFAQDNLAKAQEFISRAAEVDPTGELFYFLGIIFEQESMYPEAKKCYLQALDSEMGNNDTVLQSLGELERDYFKNYDAAESYFIKLRDTNPYFLVSLYRDYMGRVSEANDIFKSIVVSEEQQTEYELEQVLFNIQASLMDDAEKVLKKCIGRIKSEPDFSALPITFNRFYTICLMYGCGEWLLRVFDQMGLKEDLAPDYHAIKALLTLNPDAYLDTVAMEIREISKKIIAQINRFS